VTGRHSQGSPLPGCVYEHSYDADLMVFGWSIRDRECCSAWVYP